MRHVVPDVRCWTVRAGQAVTMLAIVGLLVGCQSTSSPSPGTAGTNTNTSSGNGYGGDGGDAGIGGKGGEGGNGYGGSSVNGVGPSDPAAVVGSGRLTTRTINLSGVTSIVAGATFMVHLRTGGPAQAVVRMDDNLVDRIDATVTGDQLRLGIKPNTSVRNATLSAELTVDQLSRLTAAGASRVMLSSTITSPTLALVVSGSGSVTGPIQIGQLLANVSGAGAMTLSGQAQDLKLVAAGGGRVPSADLTVRRLDATLSGVSHTALTVSDTLAVQASGVSVLRYRGAPRITRSQTSGMSSVVQDSP